MTNKYSQFLLVLFEVNLLGKSLEMREVILWLILSYSMPVFGQEHKQGPYQLDLKRESIFLGLGMSLSIGDMILKNNQVPLSVEEINLLDPYSINAFDRPAIHNNSNTSLLRSNILKYSGWLLPASLLISKEIRNDVWVIALLALEAKLLTHGFTGMFKGSVQRIRPYAYNGDVPLEDKTSKSSKRSFFSGHASNFAALSFFTAKVISDYSTDTSLKIIVWSMAVITSTYMSYLRVDAGKHFNTDVMVGTLVGGALGILIPELHKRNRTNKSLSILPFYQQEHTGLYLAYRLK